MDARVEMDPDHQAELEDRAAEHVERDTYQGVDRADRAASRADAHVAWVAHMTALADDWEGIKARSGWQSDYWWGNRP